MTPYDEQQGIDFQQDVQRAYVEAGRELDLANVVWSNRMTYDATAGGMGYPASRAKHLAELQKALSLPQPPTAPLADLVVRGQFLGLATGDYWTAVECSDFNLLARYLRGEDIGPILAQRSAFGFNLLRVWTLFDIPEIGTLTTCDYARIPAFVALCASYGLYVEFTAYTGINDPWHWERLANAAFQSRPFPLLELVNELDQNTDEPDADGRVFVLADYQRPVTFGLLCSHGSNGSEHGPVVPVWDYATFHTNDAFEWPRKVGHNAMEIWSGPTLSNENTRYPDRATSQPWAADAAAGAALLCAGSCYHSVRGKTSQLWDGVELDAAIAWATGAHSVPYLYQDGQYRHADELETPDDLRCYQRMLTDSAWTVHIRK